MPSEVESRLVLDDEGRIRLPYWWDDVFGAPAKYNVLHGGRNGAKSFNIHIYLLMQAVERPGIRIGCLREVQENIRDSSHSELVTLVGELGWGHLFDIGRTHLRARHGGGARDSEFVFRGMSEVHGTSEGFKGMTNLSVVFFDEAQRCSRRSLDVLLPTIRRGAAPIFFAMNPYTPEDAVYQDFVLGDFPNANVRKLTWRDNAFLDADQETLRKHHKATRPFDYDHIWEGQPIAAAEGAAWLPADIEAAQMLPSDYAKLADADDVVVSVDPAGSTGEKSDKTGIVVMARVRDAGYVLHTEYRTGVSDDWSRRAIALAKKWRAGRIVVEVSGAGSDALIRAAQRAANDAGSRVRIVGQSPSGKGSKWDRAQPVAQRYKTMDGEMRAPTIFHVGRQPELETEQRLFTVDSQRDDLVDALVWAAVQLGLVRLGRDWSSFTKMARERGL